MAYNERKGKKNQLKVGWGNKNKPVIGLRH